MPSSSNDRFEKIAHELEKSTLGEHQVFSEEAMSLPTAHNIVTVDVPKNQTVQSFNPERIKEDGSLRYSDIVSGIRDPNTRKNARFRLSDLARAPLSVAAEEEDRIQQEIAKRLEAKLDEIRAQTTKDAYNEGFTAGKNDGKAEVIAQAKPSLEGFENLIRQFEAMRDEIFKANEQFLIHMVYQLAKAVTLKELKEDPDYIKRLVAAILNKIGTRENIKIFVGEKDFSAAEQLKTGLAQTLGQLKNVNVEQDANMTGGGCRVETDFGEVDARLEVQIQNIALATGVTEKQ